MKRTILCAYFCLLFAFLLPFGAAYLKNEPASPSPAPPETTPDEPALDPVPPSPSPELPPAIGSVPVPATLRVQTAQGVTDMATEEYLLGVLAAEMPVDFGPEALKAQAVAARTYALYCAALGKHPDADVCTDFACCQAWMSQEALRRSWGENYDACRAAVEQALAETAGEYLEYGGEAIFAAFHSSSAGATESCGAVWGPRAYLPSVSSPETAADVPGYVSELHCGVLDLRDTLLAEHPEADFSGEPSAWVERIRRDESGRVEKALLGGVEVSGVELRRLFSLRSTAFTLEYTGEEFLFTVTGFGHGVGMSQYGAMVMGREGSSYRDILAHYYPGAELVRG